MYKSNSKSSKRNYTFYK